ncbi:MAG: hypothetical protein GY782_04865 [Gammaproteobacteria bacterium]|nr:hypothetical protein [Gammaproteobacteria bacterium]
MAFEKGNTFGTGRPKGMKNRLTNDVRQAFHKVYEEMGHNIEVDGKKQTGHEAFLTWARDNQTEFYRLYGKMIPATAELGGDLHEDFVDELVFADEMGKLVEGQAVDVTDVGNEPTKQLPSGENAHDKAPPNGDNSKDGPDLV